LSEHEELTPPTDPALRGLWFREEFFTPNGYRNTTTKVVWLQTQRYYADLRIPIERPGIAGATSFEAFSDAELIQLADVQGFAGVQTAANGVCLWRRDSDFHPPRTTPDEARFEIEGDRMAELGIHSEYTEIWRRQPDSTDPLAAFRRDDAPYALLLIAGDHFLQYEGRNGTLPAAEKLGEIVCADLSAGRRDLAISRLSVRICYGRISGGEQPWQVSMSSLPWLEGTLLFADGGGNLDAATGLLGQGGAEPAAPWRLVNSTVSAEALAAALVV
jgi:hypothetical protein